jgi:hypothetical protein
MDSRIPEYLYYGGMSRKPTPDGRRVPVSFKLTEAEAALADALRGDAERGPWLRDLAITAARRLKDSGIPEPEDRGEVPVVRSGRRPPVAVVVPFREPEPEPAPRPRAKQPCEHRVKPGSYCRSCERLI